MIVVMIIMMFMMTIVLIKMLVMNTMIDPVMVMNVADVYDDNFYDDEGANSFIITVWSTVKTKFASYPTCQRLPT